MHAAPALAEWVARHVDRPLVVGPDDESAQWVKDVADRAVDVSAPDVSAYRDRTPVVVDDIVSSAQTMVATVTQLVAAQLPAPVCLAVHALFAAAAEQALREAGAAQIVTTTSVPHATNRIDVVPLLIPAVHECVAATHS